MEVGFNVHIGSIVIQKYTDYYIMENFFSTTVMTEYFELILAR